jgi:hypothetical protein
VIATVGKRYIHGAAFLMVLSAFIRLRAHLIEPNQGFAAAFVDYDFHGLMACLLIRD